MSVLLYVALAVAALVATALVTPFGIKLEAVSDSSLHWKVWVQPFGLIGPIVRIPTARNPEKKAHKPRPTKTHQRNRNIRLHSPKRIAGAGIRLFSDVLGNVCFRSLSADVRFGFHDPADTGLVFGMLTPVLYGSSRIQRTSLRVIPVFDGEIFVGHVTLDVAIVPIKLLPPIFRFGWRTLGASN